MGTSSLPRIVIRYFNQSLFPIAFHLYSIVMASPPCNGIHTHLELIRSQIVFSMTSLFRGSPMTLNRQRPHSKCILWHKYTTGYELHAIQTIDTFLVLLATMMYNICS